MEPRSCTIYFDADDILQDWCNTTIRVLGGMEDLPSPVNRAQLNAMPKRKEVLGLMYQRRPNLFTELPPLENGLSLFNLVKAEVAGSNTKVKVLTAIGYDHHDPEMVKQDKINTLTKLLDIPEEDIIVVMHGSDKADFLDSSCLLIDDWDKNTDAALAVGAGAIHIEYIANLSHECLQNIVNFEIMPFIESAYEKFDVEDCHGEDD